MKINCGQCGEELLGSVNRCWRCGLEFEPLDGEQPQISRGPLSLDDHVSHLSPLDNVPLATLDADANDGGQAEVVAELVTPSPPGNRDSIAHPAPGSPFAPSHTSSNRPLPASYDQSMGLPMGLAVSSILLGVFGLIGSFYSPWASVAGLFGLVLGIVAIAKSERKTPSAIGIALCSLALIISAVSISTYVYNTFVAPNQLEEEFDEF